MRVPDDKCSIVAIVFLSMSTELSTKWVLNKRLLISKGHMYKAQLNLDGLKKKKRKKMVIWKGILNKRKSEKIQDVHV